MYALHNTYIRLAIEKYHGILGIEKCRTIPGYLIGFFYSCTIDDVQLLQILSMHKENNLDDNTLDDSNLDEFTDV